MSGTVTDLLAEVVASDDPDVTPDDEGWRVTDERSAEWALLTIRRHRLATRNATQHLRDQKAALEAALHDVQAAIDTHEARLEQRTANLEAKLIAWARERIAADPSGPKSIPLGAGLIKSRAGRAKAVVTDEQAVLTHALQHGDDYARYEAKVDRRKLLRHLQDTGEVVPGCELHRPTEDDRTFEVLL